MAVTLPDFAKSKRLTPVLVRNVVRLLEIPPVYKIKNMAAYDKKVLENVFADLAKLREQYKHTT